MKIEIKKSKLKSFLKVLPFFFMFLITTSYADETEPSSSGELQTTEAAICCEGGAAMDCNTSQKTVETGSDTGAGAIKSETK